jgi:hypothetical protein
MMTKEKFFIALVGTTVWTAIVANIFSLGLVGTVFAVALSLPLFAYGVAHEEEARVKGWW